MYQDRIGDLNKVRPIRHTLYQNVDISLVMYSLQEYGFGLEILVLGFKAKSNVERLSTQNLWKMKKDYFFHIGASRTDRSRDPRKNHYLPFVLLLDG